MGGESIPVTEGSSGLASLTENEASAAPAIFFIGSPIVTTAREQPNCRSVS
jgi:hypothetical protein